MPLPQPPCGCVRAKYGGQRCQRCLRRIELFTCIVKEPAGWCHALCPEAAKGVIISCEPVDFGDEPDVAPGEYAPGPIAPLTPPRRVLSAEQRRVITQHGSPGDRFRISAVAGAGKTTTCINLTKRLLRNDPNMKILYVVFNKKAKEEAMVRFPKEVHVTTSHALVRRRIWPELDISNSNPRLEDVVEALNLKDAAESRWHFKSRANDTNDVRKKRDADAAIMAKAKIEARYILKTVDNFLWSDAQDINVDHVFWKATLPASTRSISATQRDALGAEVAPLLPEFYVDAAKTVYLRMCNPKDSHFAQTQDGYLKLFQLSKQGLGKHDEPRCFNWDCAARNQVMQCAYGRFGPFYKCQECGNKGQPGYDVIIVDEAQDFTPCQADIFWSGSESVCTYLVGDARQRIYRFRGAGNDFERTAVTMEFELSETWRFGTNIADVVNKVLGLTNVRLDVVGKNPVPGTVVWPSDPPGALPSTGPMVIITRSNKGMFEELNERVASAAGSPPAWAFIGEGTEHLIHMNAFERYLELWSGKQVRFRGESFSDWEDLKDFAEDEGDAKILATIEIVERFGEELPALLQSINKARVDDWREAEFGLITAHKAKGLEFPDVQLGSDYRLPTDEQDGGRVLLPENRYRRPGWQEEINILYVAMSRAQHRLRLSPEVAEFLLLLGQTPQAHVPSPEQTFAQMKDLESIRLGDEARWANFEEEALRNKLFVVDICSVPWPRGPADNPLALSNDMPDDDVKHALQRALLRFHPDKFCGRWWTSIRKEDRPKGSALQQKLAEVTRALIHMKADWLPAGEVGHEDMCMICYDAPRAGEALRTTCCYQLLCRDCFGLDCKRLKVPRCPYCREEGYGAELPCRRLRQARPGCGRVKQRRGRSRSSRRSGTSNVGAVAAAGGVGADAVALAGQ